MGSTKLIIYFLTSFSSVIVYTMLYGQAKFVVFNQPINLDERALLGLIFEPSATERRMTLAIEGSNEGQHEVAIIRNVTEKVNYCGNTDRWLNSPRYGNVGNGAGIDHEMVKRMILDLDKVLIPKTSSSMSSLLNHTICHKDSRFRGAFDPHNIPTDERSIRNWSVKLMYLALHYHQHQFAQPEVHARSRPSGLSPTCPNPNELKDSYGVGVMDYECPKAKYLILGLCGNGLGSNVRGGMVLAYILGLLSNRVVLFINNVDKGGKYMKMPWSLASCPREDYQCFFMPPSPCTLTDEEIRNAHQLSQPEFRQLMRYGGKGRAASHHKVWSFTSPFIPITSMPKDALRLLYDYSMKLISAVPEEKYPEYVSVLKKAAKAIKVKDAPRNGYDYAAASYKMHHALAFYSLRPNPTNALKLDDILEEIIPKGIKPESSVGLPIRASDKCDNESECLTFDEHMEVVTDMWRKHQNTAGIRSDPTVVFTTESTKMVEDQEVFAQSMSKDSFNYPFGFDFVTNTRDVHPNSGFMRDISWKANGKSNADEIMLSAMSSLKAQLVPRITIGNCCSNFHAMLNDFLSEDCGAASSNQFLCLQEYEDPRLKVCCGWHHECKKKKQAYYRAQKAKNGTLSLAA